MPRIRSKTKVVAIVSVVLIFICLIALWQISRSRTFQFFGELILRINTSQKIVALTFDDGPTVDATDQILAILAEQNIKATFFVIGADLERNLDQGRKIVAAGHELGNHSYSHERLICELFCASCGHGGYQLRLKINVGVALRGHPLVSNSWFVRSTR